MEASAPERMALNVTDAVGNALYVGDRVRVTGSDRFGEDEGTVIGAISASDRIIEDGVLVTRQEQVRVRVLLDNGTDGRDYTASQGRVTRLKDAAADGQTPLPAE